MPPKSQRSRACSQCRSRRVKCDETPETCNQCRRLGLTCSGPLQGSIVIDMTERVVKPKGRKKKETVRASAPTADKAGTQPAAKKSPDDAVYAALNKAIAPLNATIQNAMFSAEPQDAEKVEKAVKAIRYYYRPPSFDQPSKALPEALDVAFLAHYVELNRNGKDYAPELQWLAYLPNLFSNVRKPAVRLSLRAASMAFYGKYHHDPSILIDSWRWYTVALGALRASIASTKKNGIPDEEEVLVPMVLAVYEIYVGATLTGSITHMRAADQIMRLRGPSNCSSRVIWPLFKTLRNSEAHKSIVYNKISVYSSPDWLTIPFIGKPKDSQQDLTDIELMIPHCTAYLGIQGSLRTVFETPTPPDVDVLPGKELACRLIKDLNRWAEDYPDLAKPSIRPFNTTHLGSVSGPIKENPHEAEVPREAVPLIGSHYLADRLVLNMLMYKMRTESNAPLVPHESSTEHYFSQAQEMSQAILKAAYEIEKASPGFDMLRSITPVVTVSCIAPTMQLKNEAKETIFRWATQFSGLAPVLERIMISK